MKVIITLVAFFTCLTLTTNTHLEAKPKYVKSKKSICKHKKLKPAVVWYGGSAKSKSKIIR